MLWDNGSITYSAMTIGDRGWGKCMVAGVNEKIWECEIRMVSVRRHKMKESGSLCYVCYCTNGTSYF